MVPLDGISSNNPFRHTQSPIESDCAGATRSSGQETHSVDPSAEKSGEHSHMASEVDPKL